MTSQSELQRFSLTSEQRHQVEPKCRLVTSQSSNSGVIDEKGDCHVVDDSHQVDDPSLGGDDVIEGEGDAPKKQNPSIVSFLKKKTLKLIFFISKLLVFFQIELILIFI